MVILILCIILWWLPVVYNIALIIRYVTLDDLDLDFPINTDTTEGYSKRWEDVFYLLITLSPIICVWTSCALTYSLRKYRKEQNDNRN